MSEAAARDRRWTEVRKKVSALKALWGELQSGIEAYRDYEPGAIVLAREAEQAEGRRRLAALANAARELGHTMDIEGFESIHNPVDRPDYDPLMGHYNRAIYRNYRQQSGFDLLGIRRALTETTRTLLRRCEAAICSMPAAHERFRACVRQVQHLIDPPNHHPAPVQGNSIVVQYAEITDDPEAMCDILDAVASIQLEETSAPTAKPRKKPITELDKAIRSLRIEGLGPATIVKRLDLEEKPLPEGQKWSKCSGWCAAFREHQGAVRTWLNKRNRKPE